VLPNNRVLNNRVLDPRPRR